MLDVLEDEAGCYVGGVNDLVVEGNGVATVLHGLQAHNLASYFLFLDGFEKFGYDTFV